MSAKESMTMKILIIAKKELKWQFSRVMKDFGKHYIDLFHQNSPFAFDLLWTYRKIIQWQLWQLLHSTNVSLYNDTAMPFEGRGIWNSYR